MGTMQQDDARKYIVGPGWLLSDPTIISLCLGLISLVLKVSTNEWPPHFDLDSLVSLET